MNFLKKLETISKKNNSLLCVGLDTNVEKISIDQFFFNKEIIDATADLVCSYKLNIAFYSATGLKGLKNLKLTIDYLKTKYREIPIIIDAKLGDIGNTNKGYVQFIFDILQADAVTVNPYLGSEAIGPFLERKDKGIIVLCRTSNSGAEEFQDLELRIKNSELKKNKIKKFYQYVAYQIAKNWNKNKNCLLVVGATYPEELKEVRIIVGEDMWILVPGIGAQGGDLKAVLQNGLNKSKSGLIINSSRAIIFAKNPREEAVKLKKLINNFHILRVK